MPNDPMALPDSLPRPIDDGAADHLRRMPLPSLALRTTGGGSIDLSQRSRGRTLVVFAYPRTGRPEVDSPAGWDAIPGARGCTPEACGFRDLSAEFADVGVEIYGLSTQDTDYQQEAVDRLQLPYPLVSDAALELTTALRLPTFSVEGVTLLRRLTMVIRDGRVEGVLYPVFPPDRAASDVLAFLTEQADG
jgi:peroxiredoxin